jgi:hypothetical protein
MMRLPTPLAASLATLCAGLVTISGEVQMSHPVHQLIILAGTFLTGLIVHAAAQPEALGTPGPPYNVGLSPVAPPTPSTHAPLAPGQRSLP